MKDFLSLLSIFAWASLSTAFEMPPSFAEPPADYRLKKTYTHLDPENQIDEAALIKAVKFFEFNRSKLENPGYMTLIDFSKRSNTRRLFQIGMDSGNVTSMLVAAGRGSDPDGDGSATEFSNENGSHQSSLGFYLTDDEYDGEHGSSLRLHGLSPTNDNALSRAIVIHGADYVVDAGGRAGRSWGCPAVDLKNVIPLIDRLKGGSLLYIFND